jgi:hypothetical protein
MGLYRANALGIRRRAEATSRDTLQRPAPVAEMVCREMVKRAASAAPSTIP